MEAISAESMTADELHSLDLDRLGFCLVETMVALRECAKAAISARVGLATIEGHWLRQDGTYLTKGAYQADRGDAKAICDSIALRSSSIKYMNNTLKQLINALK